MVMSDSRGINVKVFDDRRSWIHFGVGMLSYFHPFHADTVHCLSADGAHRQERAERKFNRGFYGDDLRLLPHEYMYWEVVA